MKKFLGERVTLFGGDSRDILKQIPDNSLDSVLTDPPYALVSIVKRFGKEGAAPAKGNEAFMRASRGFMGKQWDTGEVAFDPAFWAEILRVLKPGGHMLAFGGTRTFHRMACGIEDAGFEIRDMVQWLYGSGFPKSHDVSKGIDKAAGVKRKVIGEKTTPDGKSYLDRRPQNKDTTGWDRPWKNDEEKWNAQQMVTEPSTDEAKQWEGWGTALKPANEPICFARKPLSEKTVAANVLKWGTGAINIDGCRVNTDEKTSRPAGVIRTRSGDDGAYGSREGDYRPIATTSGGHNDGRFPANVIHDGSEEVVSAFPVSKSPNTYKRGTDGENADVYGAGIGEKSGTVSLNYGDEGSAARFFYAAKANKKDRAGSKHPTVKPISLLRYLARMITPPGGIILDPFAGSGTTGEAAYLEGFQCILIEREKEYQDDIENRLNSLSNLLDH
jgi:DNA modification methylase